MKLVELSVELNIHEASCWVAGESARRKRRSVLCFLYARVFAVASVLLAVGLTRDSIIASVRPVWSCRASCVPSRISLLLKRLLVN